MSEREDRLKQIEERVASTRTITPLISVDIPWLVAELRAAREALRPFAAFVTSNDACSECADIGDQEQLDNALECPNQGSRIPTMGDCRRAREVLG